MNKVDANNKILLMSIAVIAGIFLMIIGVTYTWFNVIIKPEDEKSTNVVVKAADLGTITFYNGEEISMDGVYPGWCETKKVSIKSENANSANEYFIYLNIGKNELEELGSTYGYVTMKSTVVGDETVVTSGSTGSLDLQNIIESSGNVLILNGKLGAGETHTYNIEFCFPELGIDQNSQQGKAFNAYLSVNTETIMNGDKHCETAVAFATDSWDTIACNVKNGNTSVYNLGDTREITLEGYGTHQVRISNTTTPDECKTEGFSQSACGFVLEFTDIILKSKMNSTSTNVGGYPASEIRTFINDSIYNSLSEELKNVIIDTTVVSGHGSNETTNLTSIDKLYLLNGKEIYGSSITDVSYAQYDTSINNERQLDYYRENNVTSSNFSLGVKQYDNANSFWFLRSAYSGNDRYVYAVSSQGDFSYGSASDNLGISLAFRIG